MAKKKKQPSINQVINTKPEVEDARQTLSARTVAPHKPLTVEEFELALLEARKIRITHKTSNKSLGKLKKRKDEIGAQARAEISRRDKLKPPKKTEAYNTLKKHLMSGSTHAKKFEKISQTLKIGNPKSIARTIRQAANEVKQKRSKKYTTKKISAQAVKVERQRARAARKKRDLHSTKGVSWEGVQKSWTGPGFYNVNNKKKKGSPMWFDSPEERYNYHNPTKPMAIPVNPNQAKTSLKPKGLVDRLIDKVVGELHGNKHGSF